MFEHNLFNRHLLKSHTGGILPEALRVLSASVVCSTCYGQSSQWKPAPMAIVLRKWLECFMPYKPQENMRTAVNAVYQFASAFLVPPLCLLYPTNSVLWAITVATIVPAFGDHTNPQATKATVLRRICLLCTVRPVLPQQQFWWNKERTRLVLQQLHRNRTFWVWVTTERPAQFSGRSKVAQRSQPCVKGLCDTSHSNKHLISTRQKNWLTNNHHALNHIYIYVCITMFEHNLFNRHLLKSHTGGILPEALRVPSASVVCSTCYGQSSQWKPAPMVIVLRKWLECFMPYKPQKLINILCINIYTHIDTILRKSRRLMHFRHDNFQYQMFPHGHGMDCDKMISDCKR